MNTFIAIVLRFLLQHNSNKPPLPREFLVAVAHFASRWFAHNDSIVGYFEYSNVVIQQKSEFDNRQSYAAILQLGYRFELPILAFQSNRAVMLSQCRAKYV